MARFARDSPRLVFEDALGLHIFRFFTHVLDFYIFFGVSGAVWALPGTILAPFFVHFGAHMASFWELSGT